MTQTIAIVRRILLVALVVSLVGTLTELLLLEHFEDAWQWAPIVLLGASLLALGVYAVCRSCSSSTPSCC